MNVRVNTDTRCRVDIFSSNIDRYYGDAPDLRNKLDKVVKAKFFNECLENLDDDN